MDYYKFCSSMLSSNCGFNKANSVKHLFHAESIARRRASGPRKNGAAENRTDEPVESRGIATAASFVGADLQIGSAQSTLGNDVLSEFYD